MNGVAVATCYDNKTLNQIQYAVDRICQQTQKNWVLQGLEGAGGGERNGMEGIVVGIEGMLGRGGKLVGKLGKLGSGGSAPGFGNAGIVGIGGNVVVGKVGIGGN
ncbi:hypothetical protein V6N12_006877 [Hibiscus sabdariffa]|uniref:Uncharacterized protein n=1 Tax=Hibiscus sabdariffa TaxID=183260 RepID=A0ABR2F057_9ROSI